MYKKLLTIILGALILITLGVKSDIYAATMNQSQENQSYTLSENIDDNYYVSSDQNVTINGDIAGDLFAGAGNVEVNGIVYGNVYTAGGVIKLNNEVKGNVIVSGGQIEIAGNVIHDLTVAGGSITITGKITGDVLAGCGNLNIQGTVDGDVRVAGGTILVTGDIGGDMLATGGTVNLNGKVGKDAYVFASQASINSESIKGDLVYYSENESNFTISNAINIGGKKQFVQVEKNDVNGSIQPLTKGKSFGTLFNFETKLIFKTIEIIGFILLGFVVLRLAPVKVNNIISNITSGKDFGTSLLVGLCFIPVSIIIVLSLLISIIGWPILGVMLSIGSIISALVTPLSGMGFANIISKAGKLKLSQYWMKAIGIAIVVIIETIPFLGMIFGCIMFIVVWGASLRMLYKNYQTAYSK